jgi:hypothetical protein
MERANFARKNSALKLHDFIILSANSADERLLNIGKLR